MGKYQLVAVLAWAVLGAARARLRRLVRVGVLAVQALPQALRLQSKRRWSRHARDVAGVEVDINM